MLFIISVMIVGLLWMIYDLINAPTVDENENFIDTEAEIEEVDEDRISTRPKAKKEVSEID
jgi:hypothetical protein